MNIEIISVGTELLLGDILNSNAQFLSREIANLGMNVYTQMTVGDNIDRLVDCFEFAFRRADIVITTGGLGPTTDDITKEGAAKYFNQELRLNEHYWKIILEKCAKFSGDISKVPASNIRQAMFPEEATIIPNNNGTAPGAIFAKDGKKIIVLPGPPREMKAMFRENVLPLLISESKEIIKSRYIRFFGIGESSLEIKLIDLLNSQTNPTMALYAKEGEVLIRVTAKCKTSEECDLLIDGLVSKVEEICGEYIYLIGDESISDSQSELDTVVARMLVESGLKISIAESCTGGLIASSLISYPGISSSLMEGCVTYSNEAKIHRLGVNKETLDKFGAVSRETAMEMATEIAKSLGVDIGISTTGIAGPNGESEKKPVGLVYFGVYNRGEVYSIKRIFTGDRNMVRNRATKFALNEIRLILKK